MPSDNALKAAIHRIEEWSVANIRWFTRVPIFLLAGYIVLHRLNPRWAEEIGAFFHFKPASLEAVVALILAIFILERTFVLEETIRQPALQISDRVRGEIQQPTPGQEIGSTFEASGTAKGL